MPFFLCLAVLQAARLATRRPEPSTPIVIPVGDDPIVRLVRVQPPARIPDAKLCAAIFKRSAKNPLPIVGTGKGRGPVITWRPRGPGREPGSPDMPDRHALGMQDSPILRFPTSIDIPLPRSTSRQEARRVFARGGGRESQVAWLRDWLFTVNSRRGTAAFGPEVLWSLDLMERKLPGLPDAVVRRHWVWTWLPALAMWSTPSIRTGGNDLLWTTVAGKLDGLRAVLSQDSDPRIRAFVRSLDGTRLNPDWRKSKAAARALRGELDRRFSEERVYTDASWRLLERNEELYRKEHRKRHADEATFARALDAEESAFLATLWGQVWPTLLLEVLGPKAADAGVTPRPVTWVWPRYRADSTRIAGEGRRS